jgi:hypothetical protein
MFGLDFFVGKLTAQAAMAIKSRASPQNTLNPKPFDNSLRLNVLN